MSSVVLLCYNTQSDVLLRYVRHQLLTKLFLIDSLLLNTFGMVSLKLQHRTYEKFQLRPMYTFIVSPLLIESDFYFEMSML